MFRYLLVTCSMLVFTCTGMGQVKISGPVEGKPNKNIVLTLEVKGNDMKVETFVNGELTKDNPKTPEGTILMFKNLQDQPILMLNTEHEAIFTFVVVVNIDNKTHVTSHVVKIGNPKPPTPPKPDPIKPDPMPTPDASLLESVKAAYEKAPDAAKLAQLIQIFEEVTKLNYRSYDDMETVLQNTAKRYLQDGDLRTTRDAISSYLLKKLGDDPRKRTVEKGKAEYAEIIKALRSL